MRTAFIDTLRHLATDDRNLWLLTGDLGFTVFERFRDELPDQYLNAGVAEQNMIGVAAGLALSGKRVFAYSIVPFATFRCLEHVRNDVCYHNAPVCVVGVGGGYSYGHMGSTHHALEDIAVMRSLANMTVVCPGDPVETACAVRAIAAHEGPCYLRLGKAGEPKLHADDVGFEIGKAVRMREGTDATLVATGNMLETAVNAANKLEADGIRVRLLSMHTVKPIDEQALLEAAKQTPLIVTLEEHGPVGGLGSATAEALAKHGVAANLLPISAPDAFADRCGSQQFFRERCGLTAEGVAERVIERLSRKG